jgi:hypothetical protein
MKTRFPLFHWVLGVLVVLFSFGAAGSAAHPAQAAPLLTLQQRIDDAANGATLDIDPGTYVENLVIHDKNLTLRGSTQATTTIQAANSALRVITADSAKGLTLENLTITGGHPTTDSGGGIWADGGTLQLVNCHITNNSALFGGGIFLANAASNLVLQYSLVDFNTAAADGGGAYAAGSAILVATQLDNNTANRHGGGLHVQAGAAVLSGGAYTNNHATTGNGGAVNVNDGLNVTGSQFLNNTAAVLGGAITQWNEQVTDIISGATFSNNTASNGSEESKGGAAYIAGGLTLTNTTFSGNKADTLTSGKDVRGGGLYAIGSLSVDGATFIGNEAKCQFCNFNEGGGLYFGLQTGVATVTHSTFDGNKGWFGAGIGAKNLNVTHSTFKNNGAGGSGGYGGGIDAATLTGDDLLFQDNTVVNDGGAVDASDVTLTHTRFLHNTAGHGGGAVKNSGAFNGSNLLFDRNQASQNYGAVLYLKSGFATATLYNITIAQPAQGPRPAVYLDPGAVMELYNSIVNNYTNAIQLSGTGSKLTEDYNLFYGNTLNVILGSGSIYNPGSHTYVTFPPGFVNLTAGDYHLTYTSKAKGGGYYFGLLDDLDFRPRLYGRNDIGAYQYWPVIFIPFIKK